MSKIQKTVTAIEKIYDIYYVDEKEEEEKEEEEKDDIRRSAIDLFLPLEKRLLYLSKYYELENDAVGE